MIQFHKIHLKLFKLACLSAACFYIVSCTKDQVKSSSQYYQYYPLKVGNYLVYNVDSIRYFNSLFSVKKPDTVLYQVMDSIQSQYIDATGQVVFRIQESRRNNSSSTWAVTRVFTRSRNTFSAQEVDGNLRYIKMTFPVALNASWSPDSYNTTDSAHRFNAKYTAVHQPYMYQNLKYDSTVYVQLQADSTLISWNIYNERYAAEIGLISMEFDSVYNNVDSLNALPVLSGFRYKQNLIDYGPHR